MSVTFIAACETVAARAVLLAPHAPPTILRTPTVREGITACPTGCKAAALTVIAAALTIGVAPAQVKLTPGADRIEVTIAGKPFTTYYFSKDVAKPYLMPLRSASGLVLTRPFPVGNDASAGDPKDTNFEPHQRPLYFAHGDVDGLDFWSEQTFAKYFDDHGKQPYGRMEAIGLPTARGDTIEARFTLRDPNGRAIGEEQQTFTFHGDARQRVIDCEFVLIASQGPMVLGDTKEGTFGIRLGPALSAPLGRMIDSAGREGEKAIWGKRANWVAVSGVISGGAVGIVVFDHPSSFRHPTTWHARGYGLLAANPFEWREFSGDPNQDGSWTIPEGKTATFRYRVLIYDGALPAPLIARAYSEYAAKR